MLSGCIMYSHSYILLPQGIKVEVVLYNIGVGLSRCSFRQVGQCESLDTWDERQSTVPTLFYCLIFSGGEQGREEMTNYHEQLKEKTNRRCALKNRNSVRFIMRSKR